MCCGDWKLLSIIQARIEEPAFPMHLEVSYEGIPVRNGPPSDPGVKIYSSQAKRRRNQGCPRYVGARNVTIRHLLRVERFSVKREFGIELPRSPAVKHLSNSVLVRGE